MQDEYSSDMIANNGISRVPKLPQPHTDILEFIKEIKSMERLLSAYGQNFWCERLCKVREIAERSDGHSIDRFLALFGGMGSLNDVVLTVQFDPTKLSTITMPTDVNSAFAAHRTRAYELAQSLR